MVRKIILLLIITSMMFSLASCGVKESINNKIVEKVSESVVKKATGDDVDLDLKGGEMKIKGEDGKELTLGSTKWPADKAAAQLPKLQQGKVISVINSEQACMITLEEVEEKDYNNYIEELKEAGFANDVVEYSSGSGQTYTASLDENTIISVYYDLDSKTISISYEKRE